MEQLSGSMEKLSADFGVLTYAEISMACALLGGNIVID